MRIGKSNIINMAGSTNITMSAEIAAPRPTRKPIWLTISTLELLPSILAPKQRMLAEVNIAGKVSDIAPAAASILGLVRRFSI